MMFLIAGTQDGRELCQFLLQRGVDVTASVTTKYGEQLLSAQADGDGRNVPAGRLVIQDRPLDEAELAAYWQAHRITAVVDASHPYAVNVSVHAMQACQLLDIPYIKIGDEFGGRDHSTIMSACSKVEKQIAEDQIFANAVEDIKTQIVS